MFNASFNAISSVLNQFTFLQKLLSLSLSLRLLFDKETRKQTSSVWERGKFICFIIVVVVVVFPGTDSRESDGKQRTEKWTGED